MRDLARIVGISFSFAVAAEACQDSNGPGRLAAPSGLTATPVSRFQINLAWTDNASRETGFLIESCAGMTCLRRTYNEIATVGPNVTTYQHTGLSTNMRYDYRVRAFSAADTTEYSNIASTTTEAADYFVSRSAGSDANAGTRVAPFKTITKALTLADSGHIVQVMPGRYDAPNGEVFPLLPRSWVSLIGDEVNKGGGSTPTAIVGGDTLKLGFIAVTIAPGRGTVIAGFSITDSAAVSDPMALWVDSSAVTIRNNRLVNNHIAIYLISGSLNQVVTGNIISGNFLGLGFIGGGVGSRVAGNTITGNAYGVEYDTPGGDLGGGAASSAGGNIISCNTANDIWTNSAVTVQAANNLWDHVPPTVGQTGGGLDLYDGSGSVTFVATDAALAPSPCP